MKMYENVDDLFLDGEIWKDIKKYNGDYQVSNFGRIKSFKYNKINGEILKQNICNKYLRINLCKNGKCKPKNIHNLLFETFSNYKLKSNECIHHKNEDKLDNTFNNFQLMDDSEHRSLHTSGENHPNYGKHHSEETKQLMREKNSGENNYWFGKYHSEEYKQLVSEKMSGENNPMFGKKRPEISKRMSGENNPSSKITEQDVIKIRELSDEENLSQKEMAKLFGISQTTISHIKTGRTWKNI